MRSCADTRSILGVPYESVPMTFPEVRGNLATDSGNNEVTCPTIKLPNNGYITDSWVIAKWVSKISHPRPS